MMWFLVALILGAIVAGVNVVLTSALLAPGTLAWVAATPVALAVAAAAIARSLGASSDDAVEPSPPPPPPVPTEPLHASALRLLATLQEEGRLIDFFLEDIAGYDDAQIGAATRGIHASCRKALQGCVTLEPVMAGGEGEAITVESGFDPATVRLTGNVTGTPPFRGTLQHGGWRATAVSIPPRAGQDPHVIAPAEVELG